MFHGFANVGNCDSYYLITHHGIHYCETEKLGLFKKTLRASLFDLDPVDNISVDTRPGSAYVRFFSQGKMVLVMWFMDELSAFRKMSVSKRRCASPTPTALERISDLPMIVAR